MFCEPRGAQVLEQALMRVQGVPAGFHLYVSGAMLRLLIFFAIIPLSASKKHRAYAACRADVLETLTGFAVD